jgi:hypothetical protein
VVLEGVSEVFPKLKTQSQEKDQAKQFQHGSSRGMILYNEGE